LAAAVDITFPHYFFIAQPGRLGCKLLRSRACIGIRLGFPEVYDLVSLLLLVGSLLLGRDHIRHIDLAFVFNQIDEAAVPPSSTGQI
jgi:hypothetical protein